MIPLLYYIVKYLYSISEVFIEFLAQQFVYTNNTLILSFCFVCIYGLYVVIQTQYK